MQNTDWLSLPKVWKNNVPILNSIKKEGQNLESMWYQVSL